MHGVIETDKGAIDVEFFAADAPTAVRPEATVGALLEARERARAAARQPAPGNPSRAAEAPPRVPIALRPPAPGPPPAATMPTDLQPPSSSRPITAAEILLARRKGKRL